MTLTFVDAGVLIAASRGGSAQAERALSLLEDPSRTFASSAFMRLEVLAQALFHRREAEVAFHEAFFSSVVAWATDLDAVVATALRDAASLGIQAMDALHVAAALQVGADELVTTEKHSRAIHRARALRVVTIHPAD